MTVVTEIHDPLDLRVAPYRDSRDADLRGRHGLFLVESEVCLRRWLEGVAQRHAGARLTPALGVASLLLSHQVFERLRPAIEAAGVREAFVAEESLVEGISGFDHHHGALGLGLRPAATTEALAAFMVTIDAGDARTETSSPAAAVVITDGVVHVDNMGSIFRNAAALGAAGVLLSSRCADPLMRKTIRISMGHVFAVPWAVAPDLPSALRSLRARAWRVLVAENTAQAIDIDRLDDRDDRDEQDDRNGGADRLDLSNGDDQARTRRARPRTAIVFGAEGHGVCPAVMAEAEAVVRIPSRDGIPLNVAVASAIVLHELGRAERQRAARGR